MGRAGGRSRMKSGNRGHGGNACMAVMTLCLALLGYVTAEAQMGDAEFLQAQAIPRTVRLMCTGAHDPRSCVDSLAAHPDAANSGPRTLATIGINSALSSVGSFYEYTTSLRGSGAGGADDSALFACQSVLQDSQDQLRLSLSKLAELDPSNFRQQMEDTLTWMSSALTYHTTCLDGVSLVAGETMDSVVSRAGSVTTLLANAVSLVASLTNFGFSADNFFGDNHNRRLLESFPDEPVDSPIYKIDEEDFPEWMRPADRKFLQTTTNLTIVDAVVAKDGSGQYKSIQAAIDAAPTRSAERWVIRVKAGLYAEYVVVNSSKTNIVLMGDGIGKTIITGSKSVVGSNLTTFLTATVAAQGANFLGRDLTIRNTAGAINHQAVALRVQGDQSAFWRCSVEAYQDTLYAVSNRQFYKDCTITGTVDFIFGNAAAVFQSCTLLARAPIPGQQNTFTAQGRTISSQNTGLSFQNCVVDAAPELKNLQGQVVSSYFGRPWKLYSRTVFLTCTVSNVIHPDGWLPWNGTFAFGTLFYGEYKNVGPGAATAQRVKWSTQITDANVANQFTVNQFIEAAEWLPQTTVDYSPALYSNTRSPPPPAPSSPKPKPPPPAPSKPNSPPPPAPKPKSPPPKPKSPPPASKPKSPPPKPKSPPPKPKSPPPKPKSTKNPATKPKPKPKNL